VEGNGLSVAQAACFLNIDEKMLRTLVQEFAADPRHAFSDQDQMEPDRPEIEGP
jgi:transposase